MFRPLLLAIIRFVRYIKHKCVCQEFLGAHNYNFRFSTTILLLVTGNQVSCVNRYNNIRLNVPKCSVNIYFIMN